MSVYIPKTKGKARSPYYHFDFQLKPAGAIDSERFCGSTGQRTKAAAERVEGKMRELAALGKLGNLMTVGQACERYMREVGNHAPTVHARIQQELCMAEVVTFFGEDVPLMAVTPNSVSKAASERASTPTVRWKVVEGERLPISTGKLPSPSTVNRQVIEPMRRVLRRAKIHWGVPIDLDQFQWGGKDGVKMREPSERVRELNAAEEARFWDALTDFDYAELCELYIISGKRQSNWLMVPKLKVDLGNRTVKMRVLKKKTGWQEHVVELTDREFEIVYAAYHRDPKSVYLFNATSRRGRDHGARRPITKQMLYTTVRAAFDQAEIPDIRPHDFRHTFGSRALRSDPNIKKLMGALDHSNISSTIRYAHVLQEDVKRMRSGVSVNKGTPGNVVPLKREGSK